MGMVIPDFSEHFKNKNLDLNSKGTYPASAIDRFFSFVIDYLIFSPVVSFFLITIMRDSVQIFRTQPLGQESTVIILSLVVSYVFLFSGLQSLFIVYWGGTPGQVFLKLQTHFENDRHFIWVRAFQRQVGFWFSFLFLGLPWMKVLLHKRHQTFYDRIADAEIITNKVGDNNLLKFENEKSYWRSLYATIIIFVIGLSIGFIWNQQKKLASGFYAYKHIENKNYLCNELTGVKLVERLQVAVTLNLVDKLSDDCLDQEADFVLWHGLNAGVSSTSANLDLAYLAKSLTTADDEAERKYLKLVCDQNAKNLSCYLSRAILKSDTSELLSYLQTDSSFLSTVLKYEFSVKNSRYQRELLSQLSTFTDNRQVKKYLLTERLRLTNLDSSRMPASRAEEDDLFNNDNQTEIQKLVEEL